MCWQQVIHIAILDDNDSHLQVTHLVDEQMSYWLALPNIPWTIVATFNSNIFK